MLIQLRHHRDQIAPEVAKDVQIETQNKKGVGTATADLEEAPHWAFKVFIDNLMRFGGLGILAGLVGWLAINRWRVQHFTTEWDELVRFLSQKDNANFMDPEKTRDYKNKFKGKKLIRYEMVARMCLAFLDDMFHQKYLKKKKVKDWYAGSLELFAGRHWEWYSDHKDSYSLKFQTFLSENVKQRNAMPSASAEDTND